MPTNGVQMVRVQEQEQKEQYEREQAVGQEERVQRQEGGQQLEEAPVEQEVQE
jgi:hypothetical protein